MSRDTLANLFQQLVLGVAKQRESKVVLDAADWAIRVKKEETSQRSKHPDGSSVLQCWAGGKDTALPFNLCERDQSEVWDHQEEQLVTNLLNFEKMIDSDCVVQVSLNYPYKK